MKLRDFSNTEIEGDDFEGIDASIDKKNLGFLFDIVSKQMYRRPINSIVREITSNCFDSHIEAKIDDPVIIKIHFDEGGDYILFKDVGVGMSPDRMRKVYSKYFSSTKRDSNDQIGMFGLGSKSPLSYTDLFYLTTNYDGIKYEYQIHTGKKTPRIELLIESETEERNGTEVKIYIKSTSDLSSFITACQTELTYFDNVYVDTFYREGEIENNYKILDYKTFKFRSGRKYSSQLHLIIGKVAYPISWDELGIDIIRVPVGLKFEIGDLQVTPERESIRYVDLEIEDGTYKSTKSIILERIEAFKAEISELYNVNIQNEFDDLDEYFRYVANKEASLKIIIEDSTSESLNISDIVTKKEGVFTPLKDFIGKIPKNIFTQYERKFLYQKALKVRARADGFNYSDLRSTLHIFVSKQGKYTPKKLTYLYDFADNLTGEARFFLIDEVPDPPYARKAEILRTRLDYLKIPVKSAKYNYEQSSATRQYKMYKDFVESELRRYTYRYDDIDIPQDWLKAWSDAHAKKYNKTDDSFLVYNLGKATLSEGKEYIKVADLERFTGFILYGFDLNEERLKKFRSIMLYSKYAVSQGLALDEKKCRIYKTAQRNEKYFVNLKNAIHVEDFMGNNKIFKRFATAAMIEDTSVAIRLKGFKTNAVEDFETIMGNIFPPVADALKDINETCDEFGRASYTRANDELAQSFYKELIDVAKNYNLYDKEMYEVHLKLERYVKGLELVNHIVLTEKVIPYLVDYLEAKGKKIDSIWNQPSDYEQALIKECKDKLQYLEEVYVDNSNCRAKGDSYYLGNTGNRVYCTAIKTKAEIKNISFKVVENQKLYNALIKYHESHQATTN